MPIGSPRPDSKAEQLREEARKKLLEQRRNPRSPRVKFHKRMMRYPVTVTTETVVANGQGRDLPFKVDALDAISAVRTVLDTLELLEGETLHGIHIGDPEWLPRQPVGRQE